MYKKKHLADCQKKNIHEDAKTCDYISNQSRQNDCCRIIGFNKKERKIEEKN